MAGTKFKTFLNLAFFDSLTVFSLAFYQQSDKMNKFMILSYLPGILPLFLSTTDIWKSSLKNIDSRNVYSKKVTF